MIMRGEKMTSLEPDEMYEVTHWTIGGSMWQKGFLFLIIYG